MSYIPNKLAGSEPLCNLPADFRGATVLEFWRWAYSNLCMNSVRGVFAEWLVAHLLDIDQPARDAWAEWDLASREGVKIEVKTSAYVQAWKQKRPSSISFSNLRGRRLSIDTNQYSLEPTYNADLYIFCLQIGKEVESWTALDLEQWRFYVLTFEDVQAAGLSSLSLKAVESRCPPMTASEFQQKTKLLLQQIAVTKAMHQNE